MPRATRMPMRPPSPPDGSSSLAAPTVEHSGPTAAGTDASSLESSLALRIQAGKQKAAAMHASDTSDFKCIAGRDASVYVPSIPVASTREAAWMRKEVSKEMQGVSASSSPFAGQAMRKVLTRVLVRSRTVSSVSVRARPNLYDHVMHGASVLSINLATEAAQTICKQNGLSSLPCANPLCHGRSGVWFTKPIGWQHENAGPSVFVDENGRCGGPHPRVAVAAWPRDRMTT